MGALCCAKKTIKPDDETQEAKAIIPKIQAPEAPIEAKHETQG
jgi:hypothetical protein